MVWSPRGFARPNPGVHTGQMQSRMTVHALWITCDDLRTRTHGHEYTWVSWAKQGRGWSRQSHAVLGDAFPALVTCPVASHWWQVAALASHPPSGTRLIFCVS